jgi:NADH-quinone oxidoreductase subunit N
MNLVPDFVRILPEILLVITGVLVMLIDASLGKTASRKPLGWLAVIGTLSALVASLWLSTLPAGLAYFGTVKSDAFSAFFHFVICSVVLAALLISIDAVPENSNHLGEYFALFLFGASGMCLMTSAVELLVVFLGLEISSISTYVLAGYRKTSTSTESAIKYFLLGSFATAFFLYGVAMVFGATGTTQLTGIADKLANTQTPILALLALGLMLVGLGFKVSAAPFQVWTPDVYEGAPSPVVALMSTAPKAAAFAVLLRITYGAFPYIHGTWEHLLMVMAALSMTIGNLAALRQKNVKRMLAYSSIAHAGYLLVAFAAFNPDGIAAAIFYTATYAAMNVGIFLLVTKAAGYDDRGALIENFRGFIYRAPLLGTILIVFLASLIGIPFTAGFVGKFFVFAVAIKSGAVWLGLVGLLNSGVAAFYYLRLAVTAVKAPATDEEAVRIYQGGFALRLALLITLASVLILGVAPQRALDAAKSAALTLQVQ